MHHIMIYGPVTHAALPSQHFTESGINDGATAYSVYHVWIIKKRVPLSYWAFVSVMRERAAIQLVPLDFTKQ